MHVLKAFNLSEYVTELFPCNTLQTETFCLWGHDSEHWHMLQTIWLRKKNSIPSHRWLVWAVESTASVYFHKLVSEVQKELVNAFSKLHAVVTTSSSCRTVYESPKGPSGICKAHVCSNQNQNKSPLSPLRGTREEWGSILIFLLAQLYQSFIFITIM